VTETLLWHSKMPGLYLRRMSCMLRGKIKISVPSRGKLFPVYYTTRSK